MDIVTERCLARFGSTGNKTHVCEIDVEVRDDGPRHLRRRIIAHRSLCRMASGLGGRRERNRWHPIPGSDPTQATCEWCRPID